MFSRKFENVHGNLLFFKRDYIYLFEVKQNIFYSENLMLKINLGCSWNAL